MSATKPEYQFSQPRVAKEVDAHLGEHHYRDSNAKESVAVDPKQFMKPEERLAEQIPPSGPKKTYQVVRSEDL